MSVRPVAIDPVTAWADDDAWLRKLEIDAERVEQALPTALRHLHRAVLERARSVNARALMLSGSTVRRQRTAISDLDYHLVGPKIETKDLSRELDLHALSEERLEAELLAGDDFVQWSLRFGCVVFDDGTVRRATRLIAERQPWPDVDRKRRHAAKSLELAQRFVGTGDEDGALVQVRTALSLVARARLLSAGIFPLSRAELPDQLRAIGCASAGSDLAATIFGIPALPELRAAIERGKDVLASVDGARR